MDYFGGDSRDVDLLEVIYLNDGGVSVVSETVVNAVVSETVVNTVVTESVVNTVVSETIVSQTVVTETVVTYNIVVSEGVVGEGSDSGDGLVGGCWGVVGAVVGGVWVTSLVGVSVLVSDGVGEVTSETLLGHDGCGGSSNQLSAGGGSHKGNDNNGGLHVG